CAANGVPLREPVKPMRPALDQARTLPIGSEIATIVLLNVAAIAATPCGMFFRSLRLVPARRAPAFGALAVAIFLCSSCLVRGCRLTVAGYPRQPATGN